MLAEAAVAPGPLHYLLEGEGFRILGSASDEDELTRILSQSIEPDVIVVDAAVPAATVMIAHEFAPDSQLIVIWPEGIVPPAAADQVFPDLVFEELGPAVRRAAERNRFRHPVEEESADEVADLTWIEPEDPDAPDAAAARTAGRVLVGTVSLITAIIVTMGASFALQGYRASHRAAPSRPPSVATSAPSGIGGGLGDASHASPQTSEAANTGCDANHRSGPNAHASTKADQHTATCPAHGGGQGAAHGRRGNGSDHGQGADRGQGSGQVQGSGHGTGSRSGGQSSHAPSDHPTGPPATPVSGDHATRRESAGR